METQWPHDVKGPALPEIKTHEVILIGEEIGKYCNKTRSAQKHIYLYKHK